MQFWEYFLVYTYMLLCSTKHYRQSAGYGMAIGVYRLIMKGLVLYILVAGTYNSVQIKEVSLLRSSTVEGLKAPYVCVDPSLLHSGFYTEKPSDPCLHWKFNVDILLSRTLLAVWRASTREIGSTVQHVFSRTNKLFNLPSLVLKVGTSVVLSFCNFYRLGMSE